MKKPAISVVIPCYNEEKFLSACLQSIRKQTFHDFEIVVVDNNCSDQTTAIARSYGARVVKEGNQGMIPARERGFLHTQGTIVARTDADSVAPPDWLEKIHSTLRNNPHAVAVCAGLTFSETYPFVSHCLRCIFMPCYCSLSRACYGHYPLIGPNTILRKRAWKKITVHFNDNEVHEDLDLACHLNEVGSIMYAPDIVVRYSMRRWKRQCVYTFCDYAIRYVRTLLLHNHKYIHYHRRYRHMQKKIKKTVQLATMQVKM